MYTAPSEKPKSRINELDLSQIRLKVVPPSRRMYRLALNVLEIAPEIKRAARRAGIVMGIDNFRETFTGERNEIVNLIQKHLAPNNPAKQKELVRQMTEA
ncbi:hypothetical protein pEaSNUABM5_00297 [Erwinia phage pEa_SNUABM_5]|uniref:Uncharacterized protein n=1 Tax=Erwinia phage pEa_SNUABM_5 TaxID=2797313 RepID=A0A7T8IWB8_9CAUD|nr:hypothetical protein MPK73_gp297 [Erwinia phage pEa_SNUABM_5]QQO90439.1 hypothetical protein pEaSNUABM5_00297 [Erwinia phage pEa_SNUABM_5]